MIQESVAVTQGRNGGVCTMVIVVAEIGGGHVLNIFWRWGHQDLLLGCGV